ncbi:hypothetical protein COK41_28685 [Bacillus cereus]|nr:hypothetical protein COK41_28685 [Bacillus cereus]
MREIKFRGRKTNSFEWVYGDLRKTQNGNVGISVNGKLYIVDAETVGQYTGLKDENNKEIYEGDIAESHDKLLYIVEWHKEDAMFYYKDSYGDEEYDLRMSAVSFRVLGNIHENPGLLKY